MGPSKTGLQALSIARTQIGVTEVPANSNWGPKVSKYLASVGLHSAAPWCMAFMHWCFREVGVVLGGYGSVGYFQDWASRQGDLVTRPFKGDIVCYKFDSDDWPDHVGIVEKVLALRWKDRIFAGWVQTIEGNTSLGNDSNGGKVMRRRRWISRAKFARIL